jgi:hypothetical protein
MTNALLSNMIGNKGAACSTTQLGCALSWTLSTCKTQECNNLVFICSPMMLLSTPFYQMHMQMHLIFPEIVALEVVLIFCFIVQHVSMLGDEGYTQPNPDKKSLLLLMEKVVDSASTWYSTKTSFHALNNGDDIFPYVQALINSFIIPQSILRSFDSCGRLIIACASTRYKYSQ